MENKAIKYRPASKSFVIGEEETESGILLSMDMQIQQSDRSFKILIVSDDCSFAKVGMRVLLRDKPNTVMFKLDGKSYFQISEGFILGEILE